MTEVDDIPPALSGSQLLQSPLHNRSTAFTQDERAALRLEGLLPSAVSTMAQQAERAYLNLVRKDDPLEKYVGLAALQDRNEHLFFRVLEDHLEELLPIVYTPTVGQAAQAFSRIFRRARGLWITPRHRGRIYDVLGNAPNPNVRLVVATDNERILGLGDLGAGGMLISIGKLALYTVAAGIHPAHVLPVSLDVGTNNPALLADDLYLGWRQPRLTGKAYASLLDEFVEAVKRRFPGALLQWEDFKKDNAFALLERHRGTLPSFNDDIQGTGAVALAALLAAGKLSGLPLREQRVVIVGAGAAGIGIARQLRAAMRSEGLTGDALLRAIAMVDHAGLLLDADAGLDAHQESFAWPLGLAQRQGLATRARGRDLDAVVRTIQPTALIGTTGQPGIFGEGLVRSMAHFTRWPVILPMSNPTSQSEAKPSDLVAWTQGRALVATGSPFPSVVSDGRTIQVAQANNLFVFPGVGLGALVAQAREITDGMFTAAAECLARETLHDDLLEGRLLPPINRLRRVAACIAEAVVREARDSGVGRPMTDVEIAQAVRSAMWRSAYPPGAADGAAALPRPNEQPS